MKKELKNLRHVIFWTAYAQDPEVLREMGNLMGGSKDRDSEENMQQHGGFVTKKAWTPPVKVQPEEPPLSPEQRCETTLGQIEKSILEILQDIEKTTEAFYGLSAPSSDEYKRTTFHLAKAEEDFMQQLLRCDNCEVPDDEWRKKRRELIKTIQGHQQQLDQTKNKVKQHSASTTETKQTEESDGEDIEEAVGLD